MSSSENVRKRMLPFTPKDYKVILTFFKAGKKRILPLSPEEHKLIVDIEREFLKAMNSEMAKTKIPGHIPVTEGHLIKVDAILKQSIQSVVASITAELNPESWRNHRGELTNIARIVGEGHMYSKCMQRVEGTAWGTVLIDKDKFSAQLQRPSTGRFGATDKGRYLKQALAIIGSVCIPGEKGTFYECSDLDGDASKAHISVTSFAQRAVRKWADKNAER